MLITKTNVHGLYISYVFPKGLHQSVLLSQTGFYSYWLYHLSKLSLYNKQLVALYVAIQVEYSFHFHDFSVMTTG